MLGKLLRVIFRPKRARDRLETQGRTGGRRAARRAPAGRPQVAAGRDRILNEAMSVYRKQQRDVYDNLDEETRRQIEEDAARAFGDALGSKS